MAMDKCANKVMFVNAGQAERLNLQMEKWDRLDHFITIKAVPTSPGLMRVVTKKWKMRAM